MQEQAHASCPSCRKRITIPPSVPSVSIEKIVRGLVGTKLNDERREHRQRLADAEKQVSEILRKCGTVPPWDWFKHQKPVFDADDGVFRCPVCVWELNSDGSCTNPTCGRVWEVERQTGADEEDGEDAEESAEDEQEVEGENEYDSQDSFICDEVEQATDASSSSESDDVTVPTKGVQLKTGLRIPGDEYDEEGDSEEAAASEKESEQEKMDSDDAEEDGEGTKLSRGAKRLQQRRKEIERARASRKMARKGEHRNVPVPKSGNKSTTVVLSLSEAESEEECKPRKDSAPKKRKKEASPPAEVDQLPRRKKGLRKKQRSLSSDDENAGDVPHAYDEVEVGEGESSAAEIRVEEEDAVDHGLEGEESDESDDEPCRICGEAGNEAETLLCDRCDHPFHMQCVGLSMIPEGSWFCRRCTRKRARR